MQILIVLFLLSLLRHGTPLAPDTVSCVHGDGYPKTAVVFSWHVGNAVSDTRWGHGAVGGEGNMFKMAVRSIRDTHPDMPIFLFTNGHVTDADTIASITIVKTDLAADAGLDELLRAPNADAKVGFGTKLQAIRTGWDRGLLPDRVIYLDVDTVVLHASPQFNLYRMVEPLEDYDITACMEGWGMNELPMDHPAVGHGWEVNTGSFAVRRRARRLLDAWLKIFKDNQDIFTHMLTGEQQALMLALERTSFRLFPLPPIYNFRRFTMTSLYNIKGPARPVITRTSVFAEAAALVEAGVLDEDAAETLSVHYTTTAVQAALQAVTDQVQQMKDRNQELHFDCDKLTNSDADHLVKWR